MPSEVLAELALFLLFLEILFMLVVAVVAERKPHLGMAVMVEVVEVAQEHNPAQVLEVYLATTEPGVDTIPLV
jgi:hypothetical protein